MSLTDRFRRQPDSHDDKTAAERAPEPKDLRLRGQIRQDDIFPTDTASDEQ